LLSGEALPGDVTASVFASDEEDATDG
jgi:hypothetical protein